MAAKAKTAKKAPKANPSAAELVKALERAGSPKFFADMSARYGIVTKDKTFGTPLAKIKAIAKPLGKDHKLALDLFDTGVYEARILASMVGDPAELTGAQMDRWCKQFDNWGVCDTLCFNLFDRSPLAFAKVDAWAKRKPEFERRAAFALLACLALHRRGEDKDYVKRLSLIEAAASDERNFVKKGVSWALRGVGKRVRAPALALAKKLAASEDSTERWIGKDALRDLSR